jgi:heme exporter protein A
MTEMSSRVEEPPRTTAQPEARPPAVSIVALRRDYGELPVVRDVSARVEPGETLAVLGPNGAGKTTLLRMLATLLRPTAGELSVLGCELPREAWRVRGRIGFLAHEPLLYRELSIRENLAFNARLQDVDRAGTRIDELLADSGLGRRGDELVRNLSAGMLQRAAVCRALLHDPELLLLDEPTSHLDVAGAEIVEDLTGARPGRTRVIVTHDVERGIEQAGAVLALEADGTVAHAGAAADFSVDRARELYGRTGGTVR